MKSLYDKDFRYTEVAAELHLEAMEVIIPIFRKYVAAGYSPREISHLLSLCVLDEELMQIISGVSN